jgi:hypothetical protein
MTPKIRIYENRSVPLVDVNTRSGQNLSDVVYREPFAWTFDLDEIVLGGALSGPFLLRRSLGRILPIFHCEAFQAGPPLYRPRENATVMIVHRWRSLEMSSLPSVASQAHGG